MSTDNTAEATLNEFIAIDDAKFLLELAEKSITNNGLTYLMVRKDLAIEAMEAYHQNKMGAYKAPVGLQWVKASEVPDPGITKWYIVKTDYHAGRCYCSDKYALSRYCKHNKINFEDLEFLQEPPTPSVGVCSLKYDHEFLKYSGNKECPECGEILINNISSPTPVSGEMGDDGFNPDPDAIEFERCSGCDGHDACEDFGCAIKAGIIKPTLDF